MSSSAKKRKLDPTDKKNQKDILDAISEGCMEKLKTFQHLLDKEDIFTKALSAAARSNKHDIYMFVKECNPEIFNRRIKQKPGIEWLCAACRGGCVDTVVSLIQDGADVNGAKCPFDQPLVEANSNEVLNILIENGARLKREYKKFYMYEGEEYALIGAIGSFQFRKAKYLIENCSAHIDVNIFNLLVLRSPHMSRLVKDYSQMSGFQELASSVLSKDVDLNQLDFKGMSPLSASISLEDLDLVKLVIDKGADVNADLQQQFPPLIMAIHTRNKDIFNFLLSQNANVNVRDSKGRPALIVAAENKNLETQPAMRKTKRLDRVTKSPLATEVSAVADAADYGHLVASMSKELFALGHLPQIELYTDSLSLKEHLESKRVITDPRLRVDIARLKEMSELREVSMKWVPGRLQLADCLTKRGASSELLRKVLATGVLPEHQHSQM